MGRQVASGLQVRSRVGVDVNTWEAMESKMTVGSESESAGAMGKSKETSGSEAEMVVGMESGVDTEVGMDLKSTANQSRAGAGAKASTGSAIVTAGGDAGVDMQSMVVVAGVRVGLIVDTIPSACVVANAWLAIAGTETEQAG